MPRQLRPLLVLSVGQMTKVVDGVQARSCFVLAMELAAAARADICIYQSR